MDDDLRVDKRVCNRCPCAWTKDWHNHLETKKRLTDFWWCATWKSIKVGRTFQDAIDNEMTVATGRMLPPWCSMRLEVLMRRSGR
jgi:hypothetical protein